MIKHPPKRLVLTFRRRQKISEELHYELLFGSKGSALHENLKNISNNLTKFIAENVPPDANGQVFRVAKRFALIAAAGNFSCKNGIFPWIEEENWNVVRKWFPVWLDER